jgi:hypothetical protein
MASQLAQRRYFLAAIVLSKAPMTAAPSAAAREAASTSRFAFKLAMVSPPSFWHFPPGKA